jgi:pseudouridine kinase
MPHILVAGGANLDIKAKSLAVNRFGTSNPSVITTSPGGVARNIAHNLARLGANVGLIAAIGRDHQGQVVLDATRKAGVDVSRVQPIADATGTYLAILNPDGEMVTASSDMRAVDLLTPVVMRTHERAIADARFIIADCNLPVETLSLLAELARNKLFIEPVSVPKSQKLKQVLQVGPIFMASPNLDQVEGLTGTRDIAQGCAALHRMGLQNVVVHVGAEGAFVSDGKGIEHVQPQAAGAIVDVTGAGDAAVAGLVFGLSQDMPLAEAASLGQKLAGRVIASAQSTLE